VTDPSASFVHESVLLEETLDALAPRSGGLYCDATLGGGGHSEAILERSAPDGRLIGVDRDPLALAAARERLAAHGDRVTFVHGSFGTLPALLDELGVGRVDGLLADVGVSSPQLDDPSRGFSFRQSGPLDMRMDTTRGLTAKELIDEQDAESLANLIYEYGEERRSRPIARSILKLRDAGELETTDDLRRAVIRVTGPKRGRIDPATRTFQALRIAVNDELGELEALCGFAADLLNDDGVVALISFHSLEDRIVKWAFRGDEALKPLTKKPVQASDEEKQRNPRARTAKLRAARRLPREVH
jgi:16S rRNA (cytosine1402-N4)-methyltransferase